MKSQIAALFIAAVAAFPVIADTLTVKADAPKRYVVKKGDTLWDISSLYLRSPWKWPELWQNNPQIDNPHLIFPGDILALGYDENGNPVLRIDKGVRKLSPQVRIITAKGEAIPTLPLSVLEPYLIFDQALSKDDLDDVPIVLGSNKNFKLSIAGHLLYVKGDLLQGGTYGIYRKGKPYQDGFSTLAYETKLMGTGRVVKAGDIQDGLPSTLRVDDVKQEIKAGDFVMPIAQGQDHKAAFQMSKPSQAVDGKIIASGNRHTEFGAMSVVVLNLGSSQKLVEGSVLNILRQSPTVIENEDGPRYLEDSSSLDKLIGDIGSLFGEDNSEDSTVWHMPSEKVGELMLFKVYDNISYAMVTKTSHPIRVGDSVTN
ncbi:peptidoglycan-binding protein [Pseudoalteromonas luteoviolacea]|uniref:Peptidoglycan-binding protein n=1 Tax=Pseudoalteromonas luteoviolacea TaxID=43657 RepID=A0A1C0TLE6_9GAMM|nr:LysM domain-containing protein [Pseudoalteromonas luteoviolacea]MBQ4812624.1 LysM peptidoglycan-binding domain-containing protein [Pseudoalteromonas luteoviolacea]OCQ19272.1 peptidoglycan-binding protein [Pseudoalteromonas luteoviolacea]